MMEIEYRGFRREIFEETKQNINIFFYTKEDGGDGGGRGEALKQTDNTAL